VQGKTVVARLFLATSSCALATAAVASETVTYAYDALGRLVATRSSGTANNGLATSIAYDSAGNRTTYSVSGAGGAAPPPSAPPPPPPPPPPPGGGLTAVADTGTGHRCQASDFNVTANDIDANGNYPLKVVSLTGDAGFSILSANTIHYVNGGQVGTFVTTYTVQNSAGATATATLTVEVPRDFCQ
jgi:hypothetical protein